jgi:hypothetical protein
MTLESLDAWAAASGQTREESQERAAVVIKLTGKSFFGARILKQAPILDMSNMKHLISLPLGLSVAGTLSLEGCTALTHLPEGLVVRGKLELGGCTALTQLPENLEVGGSLLLQNCSALTQLPENLVIKGNLISPNCTALDQLPEGLAVGGNLYLAGCTALTRLPERLAVGKNLDLSSCTGLTRLPEGLAVGKNLDLNSCTGLTQLPEGLTVGGDLDLINCSALTHLPEGLAVGGNLDLRNCTALTQLPEGLTAGGRSLHGYGLLDQLIEGLASSAEVYMGGDSAVAQAHEKRAVAGNLNLAGCTALTRLPDALAVAGNLTLSGCTALVRLPEGLAVTGHLRLNGCTALVELPEGLSLQGHFVLSGCSSLAQLSARLKVEGRLVLRGCTALAELPDDLFVGLEMNLSGCTSLTQLPEAVLEWPLQADGQPHVIDVSHSGIDEARLEALRRVVGAGVQLSHSANEEPMTVGQQFASLRAAMAFWQSLAPIGARHTESENEIAPDPHADPAQLTSFLDFLGRLHGTADFKNINSRPRLAQRIVDLTKQIAASKSLAAVCHERIGQALESCGDRVSWTMNQLEITVRVHQAQQGGAPEKELRALARSLLRLQIVHQHAAAKVASLRVVDPIEVYLVYETHLTEPLGLPLTTQGMLYARLSKVTGADVRAASRAAKQADADPQQVESYLATWEPWQALLRRQQAEACDWQRLPPLPRGEGLDAAQVCVLTQETVADLQASGNDVVGVRNARGQWEPYDFHSLLKWWTQQATHPVQRTPMRLEDLHRTDDEETESPPSQPATPRFPEGESSVGIRARRGSRKPL